MTKAQQPEIDSADDDYTIEGEYNRAWHGLNAALGALQNLALLYEGEKADTASYLVSDVEQTIEQLEATNG